MRVVKEHNERRAEIIDTAERFFLSKGYGSTTINDILKDIGIAKGTFYHYFKSKEELMYAIVDRVIDKDIIMANKVLEDDKTSPKEKLYKILLDQKPSEGEKKEIMIQEFHNPNNAEMHQRSLVQSILKLSPILTKVLEQGIKDGSFHTEYPRETMEFLLCTGQIIFDKGFFQWEEHEIVNRVKSFINSMELLLGATKGSFNFMTEILNNN